MVSLYLISPKMTLITIVALPALIAMGSFFGHILRYFSRKAQAQTALAL